MPRPDLNAVDLAIGLARQTDFERLYPERQEIPSQNFSFAVSSDTPPLVGEGAMIEGFRYISADRRRILQVRPSMMAFSSLCEPETEHRYKDWQTFFLLVQDVWQMYRNVARPIQVTRIGMRYVNRFAVPAQRFEIKEYFTTYPPELNGGHLPHHDIRNFVFQMVMPQPDINAVAILTQIAPVAGVPEGTTGLVLDIDLFRDGLSLALTDDDASLWDVVEELHQRRNNVFEACITEKTRELIK